MTRLEKSQKADELASRIMDAARQIEELENELFTLRLTDIYNEEDENHCSLWSRLGLLQTHALSHPQDLNRPAEDPCFASLALLEKILENTPQSVLQMRGCQIRLQDKTVSMCISLSTSVENLSRACEDHLLLDRHK
jgi:hypothetical protein